MLLVVEYAVDKRLSLLVAGYCKFERGGAAGYYFGFIGERV